MPSPKTPLLRLTAFETSSNRGGNRYHWYFAREEKEKVNLIVSQFTICGGFEREIALEEVICC